MAIREPEMLGLSGLLGKLVQGVKKTALNIVGQPDVFGNLKVDHLGGN